MGTTFPLTVDEVVSKQLFKAHTTELLEAGDYKLVVKSRAGDAAGPLQTSFRRVKYLRVVDPEPVPIAQTQDGRVKVMSLKDGASAAEFTLGHTWAVAGSGVEHVGVVEEDDVWYLEEVKMQVGDAEVEFTGTLDGHGGTTIAPRAGSADGVEPGTYENVTLVYQVAKLSDGGTNVNPEPLELTIPRLTVQ